jgi:hypothetical protein
MSGKTENRKALATIANDTPKGRPGRVTAFLPLLTGVLYKACHTDEPTWLSLNTLPLALIIIDVLY